MSRADVMSYGGGKQTAAMCVLVRQGRLPRPERIVIADTGREMPSTWAYLDEYMRPMLDEIGLSVDVAPHSLATTKGLYAKNGDLLLPVFTADGGKLSTLCSNEWKQRVVRRWLRSEGFGPENPIRTWIGFSVDEVHRAKQSGLAWAENHWPLLFDVAMRRDECVRLVTDYGLPEPPKSRCWMCPLQNNAEWREVREDADSWAKAIRLDESIRAKDTEGGVFVHRSGVPLSEANLDDDTLQGSLFGCETGYCYV